MLKSAVAVAVLVPLMIPIAWGQNGGAPQVLAVPDSAPTQDTNSPASQSLPSPDLPSPNLPSPSLAPPPPERQVSPPSADNANSANPAPPGNAPSDNPTVNVHPGWVQRQGVVMDMLDKEDGAVTRLTVPVGQSFVRGRLRITVRACVSRPPTAPPDDAAYLIVNRLASADTKSSTVRQPASAEATETALFRGWLVRSEPGAAVVGDATVTFLVLQCSGQT